MIAFPYTHFSVFLFQIQIQVVSGCGFSILTTCTLPEPWGSRGNPKGELNNKYMNVIMAVLSIATRFDQNLIRLRRFLIARGFLSLTAN